MKRINCSRGRKWLSGRASMLCLSILLPFYLFAFLPLFTSCSMIDEDLSDCGVMVKINYELQLVTDLTAELRTQLDTETDTRMLVALRDHLKTIFSDFAHDMDLSFYDIVGDSIRLQHEKHIVDANQVTYTLLLPKRDYMHLALANLMDNRMVSIANDEHCHPSMLQQVAADTIDSHDTGLFTARLPMDLQKDNGLVFNVRLFMSNCAVCLIIDTKGHDDSQVKVYSTGFATDFNVCDSVYSYRSNPPLVRTTRLDPGTGEVAFCSVNFPSPDPSVLQPDDESLWEFRVYAPQQNIASTRAGVHLTETILRVNEPVQAGHVKIIRCEMLDDGSVTTGAPEVGVSVTLDWKPGNVYNPEI